MEDDIIKQAALRRQRRSKKEAENPLINSTLPPVRDTTVDRIIPPFPLSNKASADNEHHHLSANRLHQRRRPLAVRKESSNVKQTAPSLPFIDIKIHGVEARALINSCVMSSIINRHLYQNVFSCDVTKGHSGLGRARDIPISIGMKTMSFDFTIRGDIPDMVIGLDFLTHHKCAVDFGNKTFTCGEDDQVTVKLVNDRDLPLKYRQNNNLAASV